NRDLQEDKAALFDAFDTVVGCLAVAAPMVEQTKFRREVIAARLEDGFLDATTLMESLIASGVPMRSAHEAVGSLVKECENRRCRLVDLSAEAFEKVAPGAGSKVREQLGVANAVAAFRTYGSTAPAEVAKQLSGWKERLD
ncbi:MAG: argininosuccinate lyase, partial [Gemmataceae bacterium]